MVQKLLESFVVGLLLTLMSYAASMHFGWIESVSHLEAFSVFTSYSCTYLCVKQSRMNYPIGAISTAALTILFWQQGLYSSMALNAYLVPTLLYGWFRWGNDANTRPVTSLGLDRWLAGYAAITAATYGFLCLIMWYFGATLAAGDSAILVLSILAQFLLDNKKIETWFVWASVNVIAIYVYWQAGLALVALQFVFFLANTIYGFMQWRASPRVVVNA